MSEIWELVDERKRKTGILHERIHSDLIPEGLYHIVVEIWTKTPDGEILLTQRSPEKPMGLRWECTMGSVLVGEDSLDGAVRELVEVTGISAKKEDLIFLGDAFYDNWIMDSYLYLPDEKPALCLQPEEVCDAKFVPIAEVERYHGVLTTKVWEHFCKYKDKITAYH
jgi:8-oxo-dGTP pyrophosphatase MutT (NUDIX family)